MRTVYALLLVTGIFATVTSQFAVSLQLGNSKPPFTLEITANKEKGHSENWDFANNAVAVTKAGTMLVLRVRKTNTSDREIDKWSETGQMCEVRDSRGNLIKPREFDEKRGDGLSGGEGVLRGTKDAVLQPGETKTFYAQVGNWYDELSQPGTYTIQVSEHVSNDPASAVVKSNIVTITVTP